MSNEWDKARYDGGLDKALTDALAGRWISVCNIYAHDNRLTLGFTDGLMLEIWDDGQSCCEHRWMGSDDDLDSMVGQRLVEISLRDVEDGGTGYDVHEQQFLILQGHQSSVTIANHNEHNGYYGGFSLRAVTVRRADPPKEPEAPAVIVRRRRVIDQLH